MRGITIPRPVYVKSVTRIGKELTADPTDTDEDFTAEMLSATDVLEYHDPIEELDAMRVRVREAGISAVARIASVSRSALKTFVNAGTTPHTSTITKIEGALQRLGAQR